MCDCRMSKRAGLRLTLLGAGVDHGAARSSRRNLGEGLVLHRNFIKTVDARRCLLICAPQTDRAESYRHQPSHRVKRPLT